MSEKELKLIKELLRYKGLVFNRAYKSFEGDIQVIGTDKHGNEYQFSVVVTWYRKLSNGMLFEDIDLKEIHQ